MKLHQLSIKPGAVRKRKRVGRGNASGHGTYSGRGCKGMGQRKSGNVRPGFEGGQTPLIMRLPKLKGFKNPNKLVFQVVNLSDLKDFKDGEEVNLQTLLEKKLITKKTQPVKVLGNGSLKAKLNFRVHAISAAAKAKVTEVGGKVL
jgi:large subunit ribosomal protein L15